MVVSDIDAAVIIQLIELAEIYSSYTGKPYALVELKDGTLKVMRLDYTARPSVSKVLEIVNTRKKKGDVSWRSVA